MMKKLPFKVWSLITAGLLLAGVFTWLLFADYLFPAISDNFTYQANILSYDNFYDERKNDFSGDILTKTKYGYSVEKKDNHVLTIRNFFEVSKPSGNPIFSVERFYGIDQITGKHVYGYGSKNRDGYLFAPKNAGNEFTYWHINYDAPAHMKLRGKEKIEGLIVYRYECDYKADQTSNLNILPGVPEERGVEMDINLKLWIEPTTGYLIKYEDRTTGWYYDMKTKKRIHPWNRFHNQVEETSISNQVQIAMLAKDFKIWQNWYFPLSILFLILILLSIGYRSDRKSSWRSYFATGLILFTGLTSSIFLYKFLKKNDAIRLETIFNRDCESIRISVQRELERSVEVLNSVKANYVSHRELTREQFRIAVNHSLKSTKNIQAVAWIPYVPLSNRKTAEMQARQDGIADFKFTELQNEHMISAGKRAIYYPIYYIEPYESNKIALGFDFASSPERKAALEKAASIGEPVVTEPLVMVQQIEEKNKSFLIMIPLYEDELGLSKNHIIHSYLSEGINISELMQEAISRVSLSNNVSVTVIDLETKKGEILFSNSRNNNTTLFEKKSSLQVANGLWELQFQSTPILNRLESSWFTIILPIVVALLAFILGIFVFSMLTNESKKLRSSNLQLTNEILERKKAEEKLSQTNKELADYKYAIDESCIVAITDQRGIIKYANDNFCKISKYSRKELAGKDHRIVSSGFHPKEYIRNLWETIAAGKIWKGEIKNKAKDGTIYWVDTNITPFLNSQGKPYQYVATQFDITERKEGEQKLNEHMHVLESQNIQLSDFCYIISHNLRGPLVNISMLIDYIESSGDELEKKEMFDKIKPVVNTINETFNELVESLQVKFDLEIKSENNFVKDSIEKALESLEFEINSSKATIETNINDAPIINFPALYLNSILFNLISNSLKYKSPERTPIIVIKTEKINNNIVLSVTDNGLGIDLKMHKNNLFKIRKVFHKHPDARGFGLFMTKTQIDAMGGKIWAESTPNIGSTFFVEFVNQNT